MASTDVRRVVPVRISEGALARLDELAGLDGRSRSEVIRMALRAGLPQVEKEIRERYAAGRRKGEADV